MNPTPPVLPQRPFWQSWCAALCVALVAFAVFFSTTRFDFVGIDDNQNVYNNIYLNPVTARTLPRFWSESYFELYTPVTYTLWTAVASRPENRLATPVRVLASGEHTLRGQPFHLLGVSLHVVGSVLLFLLLTRLPLLRDRSPVFAALGAALWAVHPLQAEPVSWVTGHNNVFSGVLMLAALLMFVKRIEAKHSGAVLGWYLLATVLYALALLSKPTAAALPLVAFALFWGAFRYRWHALLLPLGAWLFLAIGLLYVTRTTVTAVTDVSLPVWQRPFVVGDALAFYAGKILIPIHLGLDYGRQPEWLRTQAWFYAMWLVPVAVGAVLVQWHKRTKDSDLSRTVLSGFVVFVLGALPMLGLAPYYFHRFSTVSDRYVYLALIGIAIVVAALLASVPRPRQTIGIAVATAVVVLYGFLCYRQSLTWRDSISLFTNVVRVNPGSQMGHYNRGLALKDAGNSEAAIAEINRAVTCRAEGESLAGQVHAAQAAILFNQGRYGEAIRASQEAIRISPTSTTSYVGLATMLWKIGEKSAAHKALEAALAVSGSRADNVFSIGTQLMQAGIPELGLPYIAEAAQGGPQASDANYVLGVQAGNRNDFGGAEKYLRDALRYNAESGEANYALGQVMEHDGKMDEARQFYAKATALGYTPPKPVQ